MNVEVMINIVEKCFMVRNIDVLYFALLFVEYKLTQKTHLKPKPS